MQFQREMFKYSGRKKNRQNMREMLSKHYAEN